MKDPIAIVGMSCRFPQAETLQAFWKLLCEGRDTITEIPKSRWNNDDYYDPDPSAQGKSHQRHASMLEDIHDFDSLFFNISPAEAAEMNPSQKLMLELVWQAIENSTIPYQQVQGGKVGVYVGNIWNDFEHLRKHKNAPVTSHSAVGQSSNIIANRVSFAFGFTGPSLVMDTGCSSSLVALHLACQSLWDGSTELAVAAGINHILDPDQNVLLSKFGGLSKKGKCSTFDEGADGFVRGEGAGVLLLKRLSDAERDGNKIYAVVKGSAMNNNGFNVNLPATSIAGQKQVLTEAYAGSGIAPEDIHYIEAHGTGTKLGDPTETRALGEFFRSNRKNKLRVGSVKTNIGHLEAAAGMAGLIKVVLSIQNKMLPPSLNFKNPNPAIAFDELKLQVQNELGQWPVKNGEKLKAGVNSFGWGGTNAHTIIEEYRDEPSAKVIDLENIRYSLPLSAKSPKALKNLAKEYSDKIKELSNEAFHDLCVATALLKPNFDLRINISGDTKEEVLTALDDFLKEEQELTGAQALTAEDKVVFVFPGQGSQWLGMAKELMEKEPVFRKTIEACDKAFAKFTDWSLIEQLQATAEKSRLNEINVIQPALCAVQIALAKMWMSWGIRPQAVVGHSMGEVAAACVAGTISLDDAANIICTRSRLMKKVSGQGGAMAVTELNKASAEEMIQRYPALSVAVSNSPKSTVVAGDKQSIEQLLHELESKGLFGRMVKVDVASHSQQMDPLKEDLRQALHFVKPMAGEIPVYSTVQARRMEGQEMNADYWVTNLRNTVQFSAVMQQLMEDQHVVFIECSPHPVLTNAVNECAEFGKAKVITVPSLLREKPEQETLVKNLGELYTKGFTVNWSDFYGTETAPDITLPHYPFQRDTYALEDRSAEQRDKNSGLRYPLLGQHLTLAGLDHLRYWETQVSLGKYPYLADHQVNATPVFPGAGYVEIILEAASEIHGAGIPVIRKLNFIQSVSLEEGESKTVQLRMVEDENGNNVFKFFAKAPQGDKSGWTLLADGELTMYTGSLVNKDRLVHFTDAAAPVDIKAYYQSLTSLGLQYGKYFQGLTELATEQHGEDTYVSFVVTPEDSIRQNGHRYALHPALLDACFQPLFLTVAQQQNASSDRTTFLTSVDEVQLLGKVDYSLPVRGEARLYPAKIDNERGTLTVKADLVIFGAQDSVVLKVSGLQGKILDADLIRRENEKVKNWLYDIAWTERTFAKKPMAVKSKPESWIVFGDVYGLSRILLEKIDPAGLHLIHVTPDRAFGKAQDETGSVEYKLNYADKEDYARLVKDLLHDGQAIDGILHMGGIYYPSSERELTADELEGEQVYGSISLLYTMQEITSRIVSKTPKLAVVTNGMQMVGNDKHHTQVVHGALSGLVRVISNELPQYEGKRYDLSFNPMMEELDQVLQLMQEDLTEEREIALRGRTQYVPRLRTFTGTMTPATQQSPARFSENGTYLVTGFRGLGFVFIEWMIKRGARHFALLSRTGAASDSVMNKMLAYESQGCHFKIFQADTSHTDQLKSVIENIGDTMPPLKGVIHAAGVIEAKAIDKITEIEFMETLAPKVKGAWNLHMLTQHLPLECFILFSSASSLIGLSGQASYVAANSFLDVLAHRRRQSGLTAQSINWGVIKDVGMVANETELEKYARAEGFEPIVMQDAMEVYDTIAAHDLTQIGIMKIDAAQMGSYYSALARTNYFKGLMETKDVVSQKETSFLETYTLLADERERKDALEQLITRHVSKIIKMPASRIGNTMTFKGLGVDSLMAIQLRNLLEKSLELKLSVAMFWSHPSIREYATFLFGNLRTQTAEQRLIEDLVKHSAVAQPKPAVEHEWFVVTRPNPSATRRLICFHDAGGSASLYHGWEEQFDNTFEIVALELPGRGKRWAEQPYRRLEDLLQGVLPALTALMDKPFAFFGHSMGGLVAFETIRALRKNKLALPEKLFVSSTPSLFSYDKRTVNHQLSDGELAEMFPHVAIENVEDLELQQILIRILRADLELLNNYHYVREDALPVSIVAFHGQSDPRVTHQQVEQWEQETTKSFALVSRPGGHRYVEQDAAFVTATIQKTLAHQGSLQTINQPA
ncbi:type I polyketide synthase [Chryseolinea lacunae]|uniref:SDR family NAD(P)-dependent oxidoreductase n=1 Tax=Chryseolinea lacunae TaxID=2801331 RepID=A0ABS1KMB8_9BACT|nr:type I polyketide synthase [Chryseolinea lacunae]MBL0740368.1 SDR family NAD(P)-dependent oxidoreductase [Chryseolinea lacunae]